MEEVEMRDVKNVVNVDVMKDVENEEDRKVVGEV